MKTLEFRECLVDSPWHRGNLKEHEAALESACKAIKRLEAQCAELVAAANKLSSVQRSFAESLSEFSLFTTHRAHFQTDDERGIDSCVQEFANLINQVEDQRERILKEAEVSYIEPLRKFRTERIGRVLQEDKKQFEKASRQFYSSLDKHLSLNEKTQGREWSSGTGGLRDADAGLEMSQRHFHAASLDYVNKLQSVEERMSFEFIYTLSSFLYSFLSFYHVGYRIHEDFKPALDAVVQKVHVARESYEATQTEAEELKAKMLNCAPQLLNEPSATFKQGYLYLMEKKRSNLGGISWTAQFCVYQKDSCMFTMIPFSSSERKTAKGLNMHRTMSHMRSFKLKLCRKRQPSSIDRRFCFDVTTDRDSESYTFQAQSEEDLRNWLQALNAVELVYAHALFPSLPSPFSHSPSPPHTLPSPYPPLALLKVKLQTYGEESGGRSSEAPGAVVDEAGFFFVTKCLGAVEARGLDEQGLYRNCGVTSKVQKLLAAAKDKKKAEALNLADSKEFDLRTITSAVKAYLRTLGEPLMTWELHGEFINAGKVEGKAERVGQVHHFVHKLPEANLRLLHFIIQHLAHVASRYPTTRGRWRGKRSGWGRSTTSSTSSPRPTSASSTSSSSTSPTSPLGIRQRGEGGGEGGAGGAGPPLRPQAPRGQPPPPPLHHPAPRPRRL